MKNITRRDFVALAFAAIATAATPKPAHAIPVQFRYCPRIKQNDITYLLYGRYAIVTRCPVRQSVTIPHSIKHKGRAYTVSAIWEEALTPTTTRVVLKARDLDTIEDARIWSGRVTIICTDKSTRDWLREGGAKIK